MSVDAGGNQMEAGATTWQQDMSKYAQPDLRKAVLQILNTFIPYLALWVVMVYLVQQGYPYWMTLVLAVVASGMLVRVFIIFHDCCHGSFFASRRANTILGYISGILTFTPFDQWRHSHAVHHATSGDLDRRGRGDVWMMTVDEYLAAPKLQQLVYRIYRNPLAMFGVGPAVMFLVTNRLPHRGARANERRSVLLTNLGLLAIVVVASLTIGLRAYLLIQLPIILITGTLGIWLFYVQHQYEGVCWARHEEWDLTQAALEGSSYYKLPKVLQWFTGNIGLHHIHHLRQRIPNYNLQQCYDEIPALQAVEPLTIRQSLKSLWMRLWDEKQRKMVGFGTLKGLAQ